MISGARDTVNIDESVHEIYKQLTEGNDPINAPFKTMKDVFMWAACLGFQKGERRPMSGKKMTIFRWAQFNAQVDMPTIKAIVLSKSGEAAILLSQDKLLDVLEEYANSGIHELKRQAAHVTNYNLWDLVSIISLSGD